MRTSITRRMLFAAIALMAESVNVVQGQVDTTFVQLADGTMQAFPAALIAERSQTAEEVVFTDIDGGSHTIPLSDIVAETKQGPKDHPWLKSFKFNNKYNSNIYTDVVLDPAQSVKLNATVPCIGKWLRPSFQLSSDDAAAYVGNEVQQSKVSRHRFDKDITYTVALPDRYVLRRTVEEPAMIPDEQIVPIPVTKEMLSTNAPSNYPETEDMDMMLDGNTETFFHSTWGDDGPFEKLPLDKSPWIGITLPESVRYIQFYYCTRMDTDERSPKAWEVQVSYEGWSWKTAATLKQDIPLQGEYTSPTIDLKSNYRYVRFVMTDATYKNYLCLSELRINKVVQGWKPDPDALPAAGHCEMMPLGTDYTVHIDFPTDNATNVPRVDLQLDGVNMITSRKVYIDATISIDGAGVFPSMEPTPVQVKGRGNSSWSDGFYGDWYSPKNPYRLKFAEKVKPFGLTKGKNWVLLANNIDGSMTTNAIGMKVAGLVGTVAANHIVPVELYINGEYYGNYNFTEKVGFHNNSIDLDDVTHAALIELDTYDPDKGETKFITTRYSLPAKVKYPNFIDDETELTIADIKNSFNKMLNLVPRHVDLSDYVDVEALAKYYMVNEFILNLEIMHPKSTYLYHPDISDPDSRWTFGPVWDLDWAFGHELNRRSYFTEGKQSNYLTATNMESVAFWKNLRKCGESLDRAIYAAWYHFMEEGALDELLDFCDDYYDYARPSLEHNGEWWWDGFDYDIVTDNAKKWLEQRARYIYSKQTPYDLNDDGNGIESLFAEEDEDGNVTRRQYSTFDVYDLRGLRVRHGATSQNWRDGLPPGLYIICGRKVLVD